MERKFSRLGRGADSARARRRRDEAVPLRPRLHGRKVLTARMSTGTQSTHITPEVPRVPSEYPRLHAGTPLLPNPRPRVAAVRTSAPGPAGLHWAHPRLVAHTGTGTAWAHPLAGLPASAPALAHPTAHIGTGSATQQRSRTCCNNERLLQLLRCESTRESTPVSTLPEARCCCWRSTQAIVYETVGAQVRPYSRALEGTRRGT